MTAATENRGDNAPARTPKTVRFWFYHVNGFVKIGLQDGETRHHYHGSQTDEGYHGEGITFRRDGNLITFEAHQRGRDCDGGYGRHNARHCPLSGLKAARPYDDPELARVPRGLRNDALPPARLPEWQDGESSQYDETAESMNY